MTLRSKKEIWVYCPDRKLIIPKSFCKECTKYVGCEPSIVVRKVKYSDVYLK